LVVEVVQQQVAVVLVGLQLEQQRLHLVLLSQFLLVLVEQDRQDLVV
jgi:hypothetical protein